MMINYNKTQIMKISKRLSNNKEEIIDGFKTCNKYKYLGTIWSNSLDPRHHIADIAKKIHFITHKVWILRKYNNIKNNRNLFETLILPHLALLTSSGDLYTPKQI